MDAHVGDYSVFVEVVVVLRQDEVFTQNGEQEEAGQERTYKIGVHLKCKRRYK